MTATLPDAPTGAVVVDTVFPNDVYVGNDVGVFVSHDAGATWESFNAGLPEAVMVTDLAISPMDRSLRVGTHGNGMWKRSLEHLPVASEPGAVPDGFALESITPNPVRTDARVAFRLSNAGHVRISVFDMRGREVDVLANGVRATGRHEVTLRAQRLSAGSYVVRMESGRQSTSRRVSVVR